jgi:uncharacterized protein YecA (UPF0149 family)
LSFLNRLKNLFSPSRSPRKAGPTEDLRRNDPCWCGSGKKYKRCHRASDEKKRYEEAHAARVAAQAKSRSRMMGG